MEINDKVNKWIEEHDYPEYCEYCRWNTDCSRDTYVSIDGDVSDPPCCACDDPTEYLETESILEDLEDIEKEDD